MYIDHMNEKIEQVDSFRNQRSVAKACKKAGIAIQTYYSHRKKHAQKAVNFATAAAQPKAVSNEEGIDCSA